jgi:hypothetical protein
MEQGGFLARNVGTGTFHNLHFEAAGASVQIASEVTGGGSLSTAALSFSTADGYSDRT